MAAISQTTFSKVFFMNEKSSSSILISLKFVPESSIKNKSALVQVMAWHLTGDKPLPEPLLTSFTNTYMQQGDELTHWPLRVFYEVVSPVLLWNWSEQNPINDKSTFVLVMAQRHQGTSHLLYHYWPSSMSPYGIIRPQWLETTHHWWIPLSNLEQSCFLSF